MNKSTIGVIVAVIVISLLLLVLVYTLTTYYLHYGFSSGNWVNRKGDIVVIRNKGILGNSQLKIGAKMNDAYDIVKYNCRMFINPFSLPHKFTMYMKGEDNLHATINMLTGKMRLYKDNIFYDEFVKSNMTT